MRTKKNEIEIAAILKTKGGKTKKVALDTLELDEKGLPSGVRLGMGEEGSWVSLQDALAEQGRPEELFITDTAWLGRRFHVCGELSCRVDSFLEYMGLKPSQIKVVRYAGSAAPRRIEIRKRDGIGLNEGELLATIELGGNGYPEGVTENIAFTLLGYLIERGKVEYIEPPKERRFKLKEGEFHFKPATFIGLAKYFAYLKFKNIGPITILIAKRIEDSVDLIARVKTAGGVEERVIHHIKLYDDGIPLLARSGDQRSFDLVEILFRQDEISEKDYSEFIRRYSDRYIYPTKEAAERALIALSPEERTFTALNRSRNEGGNRTLLRACRDFGIELEKAPRVGRQMYYPTLDEARRALAELGPDVTASDLNRPRSEGGNYTLLYAVRRFKIPMPRREREPSSPFFDVISTLLSRSAIPLLSEEDAVKLWRDALCGDEEAKKALITGLIPLVKIVIEEDLGLEMNPNRFNVFLIELLLSDGDLAISQRWDEWNGEGSFVAFIREILVVTLRESKKDFYIERAYPEMVSAYEPLGEDEGEEGTFTYANLAPSREYSPFLNAAVLIDGTLYDDTQIFNRKDASMKYPIISAQDKEALTLAFRELFSSTGLFSVFENGGGNRWALITVGSLGRLGTAVRGSCDWNAILITDMSKPVAEECLKDVSRRLSGSLQQNGHNLPTILIGNNGDGDFVREVATRGDKNGGVLGGFLSILDRFDVGSTKRQFATIETVTVDGDGFSAHRSINKEEMFSRRRVRVLAHAGNEEVSFQAGVNGIVVAESNEGAARKLLEKLASNVHSYDRSEVASAMIDIETRFFDKQRENITRMKRESSQRRRLQSWGRAGDVSQGVSSKLEIERQSQTCI